MTVTLWILGCSHSSRRHGMKKIKFLMSRPNCGRSAGTWTAFLVVAVLGCEMDFRTHYKEVYSQDFEVGDSSHGWIQWKGTAVCIDLHCKCGQHDHLDVEFLYYYRCSKCKTVYAVGQTVKLIPLTEDQEKFVTHDRPYLIHSPSEET